MRRGLNKMSKKLIAKLGILGLALIFFLSMASYSIDQEVTAQGKPDPKAEQITFCGDLEGDEAVYGCCPNAGPFPPYTMTLGFDFGGYPAGTAIPGWLFINYYGAGRDQKYKVQFWWDYDNDLGIEIIGGEIHHDRKTKELTVTFEDEECVFIKSKTFIKYVYFTLIRKPY
jgi:hypothetical protein